jgi:proteasome lid subunit RPN8/RPN11
MTRLILPSDVLNAVLHHADAERPNECCGFLAGSIRECTGYVVEAVPIVNELRSPTAYRTEPRSLFAAYRLLWARQYDLIAVYHSHPQAPAVPSRRDRKEWTYGESACAIIGTKSGKPDIRAWRLRGDQAMEIDVALTDTP